MTALSVETAYGDAPRAGTRPRLPDKYTWPIRGPIPPLMRTPSSLDDGLFVQYVQGLPRKSSRLTFISAKGKEIGLVMNERKTEIIWAHPSGHASGQWQTWAHQ